MGLRVVDILQEAAAGLFERPGRSALTGLGTVLGVAALVATLGLASTAGNQIVQRLDALEARDITVQPADPTINQNSETLEWAATSTLLGLNGVETAVALAYIPTDRVSIRPFPYRMPGEPTYLNLPVVAASPTVVDAIGASLVQGRTFDQGHVERADRVALIGRDAAVQLGIERVEGEPAISIGDYLYQVTGIFDSPRRESSLTAAVVVTAATAARDLGVDNPSRVLLTTAPGANSLISAQAPMALAPHNPTGLTVSVPPEPIATRRGVEADIATLFLSLAGVTLLIGTIGIANTTLVSVLERTSEIGLRRALGARRRHIAIQFLAESTLLGSLSGVIGTALGIIAVLVASYLNRWTPVLPPLLPPLALAAGSLTGLLAGLYPSVKAARLLPADALRTS